MFKISKSFTISASHAIEGLPSDHKCSRLHGHNYEIEVVVMSPRLDSVGFVVDYQTITDVFDGEIKTAIDHRHLNDVIDMNPTAEHIALWVYNQMKPMIPELSEIIVRESGRTAASFSEWGM